jgi:peptidoglycan/xylan/chitin deacetylase (PgdA/CDA1 family)
MLKREIILNFHGLGIPHPDVEQGERGYWWSKTSFTRLLDQVVDLPYGADPRISITFDDGNASDVLVALPELARRRLTASFFVCAGRIGKKYYVDKPMIRDLVNAGMIVGSHGMYHRNWRELAATDLEIEITDARKILQDVTERYVTCVAIPFGSYNRRILTRLWLEPWDCVYSSDGGIARADSKFKPRVSMTSAMEYANVLPEILNPPIGARLNRAVSRIYKALC